MGEGKGEGTMIYLIHYSEIGLKGRNRAFFERMLAQNIARALGKGWRTRRLSGRLLIENAVQKEFLRESASVQRASAISRLQKVFGVSSIVSVAECAQESQTIAETALSLMQNRFNDPIGSKNKPVETFRIETQRSDKTMQKTSVDFNREIGEIVRVRTGKKVRLKNPDLTIGVELVDRRAFVSVERFGGPGGLPVGVSGTLIAMLSGGIDSPVAAWRMMKRGCKIIFAHFHSYPFTSRSSIDKVRRLAQILAEWQGGSKLYCVPIADLQKEIVKKTNPRYRVILYRRFMVRIAEEIARNEGALGIVTGDSVGQVASQTLENLAVVSAATALPIYRPLAGEDKEEIIARAKQIGTFEISIEPHDDCCSLFMPDHPATRSTRSVIEREEGKLEVQSLVERALKAVTIENLKPKT